MRREGWGNVRREGGAIEERGVGQQISVLYTYSYKIASYYTLILAFTTVLHKHTHTHACTHARTHKHTHTHTHTHAHTRERTHTHTHTHTHTCMRAHTSSTGQRGAVADTPPLEPTHTLDCGHSGGPLESSSSLACMRCVTEAADHTVSASHEVYGSLP